MSTLHFRNAKFEVNNVDLSDHVESITLNYSSEMLDETAMGDSTRINKGGLKNWSIEVTAHQDFASADWDSTLWAIVGTTACFEVRPQNICSTTINPRYDGIGIISSYQPVGGDVGTLLNSPITVESAGDLGRAITAT